MTLTAFHLAGQHDQSTHGDDGGVSTTVGKLKSGGTVKLAAGESLARSDVVQQRGGGGALLAAVDTDDGARRVRLGVIGEPSGVPKWSASNKGATAELSPAQARALADGMTDSTRKARQQHAEAEAVIEILEDGGWDPDDRNPSSEQRELLDRHDKLTSGLVGNQQTISTPWGDVVYGTRVTDSGPSIALAVVSDDADADWTIDDAISDGTALDLTLAQVRALASKLRANAGGGQTAAVDDFQGDIPDQLADYWLRGKGAARVRWCTRGSFRRARRLLRGKVPPDIDLDGLVANLYHRACGRWPGRRNEAAAFAADGECTGNLHRNPVTGQCTCPDEDHHVMPDGTCMHDADMPPTETGYQLEVAEKVPTSVGGNPDDGTYNRVYWSGPLAPIDIATGDRRKFAPGALSTRQLPLPFRWQEKAAQGHDGSVVVGSLTGYDIAEDGTIMGRGYFLNPEIIPDVRKAMHLVEHGVIGPSVDLEPAMDVTWVDEQGEAFDTQQCQVDGDCPDKPEALITAATIAGATLVPITAFAEARAPRLSDHGEFCLNPLHPGPCAGTGSGGGGGGKDAKAKTTAADATNAQAAEGEREAAQAPGRGVIDALIREKFLDAPQTPSDDRTPEERAAEEERVAEQARVQSRREQRAKVRVQAAQARERYGPRSKWPKRVRANVEREEDRVSQLASVPDAHAYCRPHEFCRTPLHPGPCKGWKRGGSKTPDGSTAKPAARSKAAPKATPAAKEPAASKPSTTGKVTAAVKPRVMDADWKPHNDSLSKDQRQAVHDYTTSDYFAINNALKGTPPKTARERKAIEKTTALIRSSMAPAPRGTKVFRGTNTASVGLPKNPTLAEMKALVGKTLVNDAFTSTSVSADEIFAGNLEFDIEMPEGTPSLWLNGNSRLPDEHEVLLDAGSRMQVLSVRESPVGSGNFKVKTRMTP